MFILCSREFLLAAPVDGPSRKDYEIALEYVKVFKQRDQLMRERVRAQNTYNERKKMYRDGPYSKQTAEKEIKEASAREKDEVGKLTRDIDKIDKKLADLQKKIKKDGIDQKLPSLSNNPPTVDPGKGDKAWVRKRDYYQNKEWRNQTPTARTGQQDMPDSKVPKQGVPIFGNDLNEELKRVLKSRNGDAGISQSGRSDKGVPDRPILDSETSGTARPSSKSTRGN
jgi:hypothetical protein